MTQTEILEIIVKALDSKRGENIRVIGVTELTTLGDYFVVVNGNSSTQTRALADEVEYKLAEAGIKTNHREGRGNNSTWIVLDYQDIVIHVFYKETRDFYNLERLWADGEEMDISDWLKKEEKE